MGSHSSTETIVALFKAFLTRRTWQQAELARCVGVSTPTVHKRLCELQASGVPLETEKEHPHVFWSVPKNWYPGGVLFTGDQVKQVFRQLSRLPKGKARDALLDSLRHHMQDRQPMTTLVTAESSSREEQHLSIIEDAAERRISLSLRYFTASRGCEGTRHASVHRVHLGPPARFIATCHRTDRLKWFRVENVSDCRLDTLEAFRAQDPRQIAVFERASLDGFHQGGPAAEHAFFVREPEARWVARNLLEGMQCQEVPAGIRISAKTSALQRLAAYVVGLGSAAKPLTPELESKVVELAQGALSSIATPARG